MRKLLGIVYCCLVLSAVLNAQNKKTKVLLLGCFHFDNPGLDVAKFENVNITSFKRQKEVQEVVEKLKQFKPDKIFVEVAEEAQSGLDSNLTKFKAGQLVLKETEVHQLGFRLAKDLNLSTLYAIDYRDAQFPFDSLVSSAKDANQIGLLTSFQKSIDSIQNAFNESVKKNTIREMLLMHNTKTATDMGVGFYYDFLVAGKLGNHVGSYLTSEWWRRNMVIYENILKRISGKEERILVIFGAGHTALLQAMMQYNKNFQLVTAAEVL